MEPDYPRFANEMCCICRDLWNEEGNKCLALKCGHLFHSTCFNCYRDVKKKKLDCCLCKAKVIIPVKDLATNLNLTKKITQTGNITSNLFVPFLFSYVVFLNTTGITERYLKEVSGVYVFPLTIVVFMSVYMLVSVGNHLVKLEKYGAKEIIYVPSH